jgi:hypothetical protein
MMKALLRLLAIAAIPGLFSGCIKTRIDSEKVEESVTSLDIPEIVHVLQNYFAYLRYEKHLLLDDAKVYYDSTINTVRLEFLSQDILEVREARMLLVDVVEGLLAELNRNPIIAPEFITYPLTAKQLEIYIDFESYYGFRVDPYYIGWIKLEGGTAYYYAFDLKFSGLNEWNSREESYDKSRELVIFERESEQLFEQVIDIDDNTPDYLEKEQYRPPKKCRSRFFPDYCAPANQP